MTGHLDHLPGAIDALIDDGMGASAISKVLSSARPLSPVEFADALFSTWGRHNPYERRRTNAFGMLKGGLLQTYC